MNFSYGFIPYLSKGGGAAYVAFGIRITFKTHSIISVAKRFVPVAIIRRKKWNDIETRSENWKYLSVRFDGKSTILLSHCLLSHFGSQSQKLSNNLEQTTVKQPI